MKILAVVLLMTMVPGISRAQLGSDDKEQQFEMEQENLDIHDSEAQRKAAKDEALHQEKLEKERLRQLKALQIKKELELKLAKKQMAAYQDRIKVSEKKRKGYEDESGHLERELTQLRDKVSAQENKAKDSEVAAADALKLLNSKKQEKIDLLKRDTQSTRAISRNEDKIRTLKLQYARLNMETRQLEGHLKMMEEADAKKELEREKIERDVSSMKDRRKAASDAVNNHSGN